MVEGKIVRHPQACPVASAESEKTVLVPGSNPGVARPPRLSSPTLVRAIHDRLWRVKQWKRHLREAILQRHFHSGVAASDNTGVFTGSGLSLGWSTLFFFNFPLPPVSEGSGRSVS